MAQFSQIQLNIISAIVFFAVGFGLASGIAWVIHKGLRDILRLHHDVSKVFYSAELERHDIILQELIRIKVGVAKVWKEMHNKVPSQTEQIEVAVQALVAISCMDETSLTPEMRERSSRAIAQSALEEINVVEEE